MGVATNYPIEPYNLLRKKKSIRRDLLQKPGLLDKRIAILGGSTTAEVRDMLELFLLDGGIRPVFYESAYNRYYEDIMFPNPALERFSPDIIYFHTSSVNITRFPLVHENETDIKALLSSQMMQFQAIWDQVAKQYNCSVIQNNFEWPYFRALGNLDSYDIHGRTHFIAELNAGFSTQARQRRDLYLNDINYLSAWFGLERWYDKLYWYSYKYAMNYEAIPFLGQSVAAIIKAIFGKTKKCLVLDLDNTLWGGVIGDDGPDGIRIGIDTPEGEAYADFQQYVKELQKRGIILAVCSKNDEKNAREGFLHPSSILKVEDFSAFQVNLGPKPENIDTIARSLNIGMDSLVFVDDNPVERNIVTSQMPQVSVPELGNNITTYINILDKSGLFETTSISPADLQRATFYADNAVRQKFEGQFNDYNEFLRSLLMKAEIRPFASAYLERITQLINKTNQFNVTSLRYTQSEIENISGKENYITLYGRLFDKFGDSGLISVVIGEIRGLELHIDLWLMSCRVLKRGVEESMFDRLVATAQGRHVATIYGYYYPTAKNGMTSGLFEQMGFTHVGKDQTGTKIWKLDISKEYNKKNYLIEII